MGGLFLRQREDFFTEGLCFDNRKEGEGTEGEEELGYGAPGKSEEGPRIRACARRKVRSWPKAPLLGFEQAQ
jgi:hypothetical protein